MRPGAAVPTLVLLLALAGPVRAWAPETRIRIADEAVRLMPKSLRLALERYREPLLRGLLEPQLHEESAEHRPPWLDEGSLDAEIERRARALIDSVHDAAPFREIASNFGALAHFTMDAGFPPGVTGNGTDRYAHFARLCEERRPKFPVVFYGHDDDRLAEGDYRGFALAVLERSREEDAQLARSYAIAGNPPDPAAFDDRSVPFAVASLSYSRTISDVARVWFAAWRDAYGDTGRTPYRKPDAR